MGLLNSLKGVAGGLLEVAEDKLSKAVDTATSYLSVSEPEPEVDLVDMLNDMVYKHHKYEKAIGICKQHLYDDDMLTRAQAYYYRAVCMMLKAEDIRSTWSEFSEEEQKAEGFSDRLEAARSERSDLLDLALKDIDVSLKICWDNDLLWYDFAALYKGHILYDKYEFPEARRWYIYCMGSSVDGVRMDACSSYDHVTEKMLQIQNYFTILPSEDDEIRHMDGWTEEEKEEVIACQHERAEVQKFSNHFAYGERQFLFVVKSTDKIAGCFDRDEIINWVFTQDKLPADLTFPVGHPQANTLYIAHPAQKGLYLPYEGAEEKIFHEKVEDFCRLAQCLGAREISFRSLKGESVSEGLSTRLSVGGGVGVTGNSVGADTHQSASSSRSSERQDEVGYSYVLQPVKAYVPDDLPWLDIDKSWQTFVKQRMESNLLSYTKRISSSETVNLSTSLASGVKTSFNNLMQQVNANFDVENDTTFSHSRSSEWEIRISFASLEELHPEAVQKAVDAVSNGLPADRANLTPEEELYKEEVLFILEDGEITETERRFLERKRLKLGVSEDRAAYVESLCAPSLTEEEKEYLELYKELSGEGELSERKRKMLAREAASLGITPDRVVELETMVNP